jgi:hypothetical protein
MLGGWDEHARWLGTLKKTLRHAEEKWAPLGAASGAEPMQM